MTPVGHSMVGAAVGVLVMPRYKSRWASSAFLAVFVGLANLPDWSLPGWGHFNYKVSHSIVVNLALIVACILVYLIWFKRGKALLCARSLFPAALAGKQPVAPITEKRGQWLGAWPLIFGGAVVLLSHFLLDSFYNHGLGIGIFWPFSPARLALPMPWFRTLSSVPPPLNIETLCICLVELFFYAPILILAVGWRYWRTARNKTTGSKLPG